MSKFKYNMSKFNYYVIHCHNNIKRFTNIKNMEHKLSKNINIFKAIIPQLDDQRNITMYDNNLNSIHKFSLVGELGCYLSHYLLIKSLINSEYDYTVIFEDDFNILISDLDENINYILSIIDIDFDFLFLGTQSKYFGEHYKENIYHINKDCKIWGFQGYIINNKKINKILEFIKNINYEIDIQVFKHIKKDELIGLFVNPIYISQNNSMLSTIRLSHSIKNTTLLLHNQRRKYK